VGKRFQEKHDGVAESLGLEHDANRPAMLDSKFMRPVMRGLSGFLAVREA
jgi:hypothetical protein